MHRAIFLFLEGKSTLGNKMVNSEGCFEISCQKYSQTCNSSAMLNSGSQCKSFMINVYDHDGLLEGTGSVDTLSSSIPGDLNLIIFVLKRGHNFDAQYWKILQINGRLVEYQL